MLEISRNGDREVLNSHTNPTIWHLNLLELILCNALTHRGR
jgi:hypothetical protein